MNSAYLRRGVCHLPGIEGIAEILHTSEKVPVKLQPAVKSQTLGLTNRCGLLPTCDLTALKADRILKKTSEHQSHWLIYAGCRTWQHFYGARMGGDDTGLFLGLATIDCEDDTQSYCFANTKHQTIAETVLCETKPLYGLTLINSTVCSHLATQLQITGPNAAFSPHADAGASALIEACFNTIESKCARALCGAGSQKITPWYFLAYEELLIKFMKTHWFPTEASAFVTIDSNGSSADGIFLDAVRAGGYGKNHQLPSMDRFLSKLRLRDTAFPGQVVHAGTLAYCDMLRLKTKYYLPEANQVFIDSIVGYAGPAAALLAVNLALEILSQGVGLDQRETVRTVVQAQQHSVLVIARGLEGQVNYILLGKAA